MEGYYITDKKDLERLAYKYAKYIHADPSVCGYSYFICGTILALENPELDYTGDNGIYAKISEKFHAKSIMSVERGIRHLCEKLYKELTFQEYLEFFGTNKKLTNRQLIAHACNAIRYENEKFEPLAYEHEI